MPDFKMLYFFFRAMVHLSRYEAEVGIFAPNIEQMHTIDHTKGEPMDVNRSVMEFYKVHNIFVRQGSFCLTLI